MIAFVKFCKKNSKSLPFPYFNFSFFFLSKDRWKTKRNPSKPKVVYLKKYRLHARKVENSEHAIYDVWERVRCSLTGSRHPAVRRPAPRRIKMYGFCRLFRAMTWSSVPLGLMQKQRRARSASFVPYAFLRKTRKSSHTVSLYAWTRGMASRTVLTADACLVWERRVHTSLGCFSQ